MRHSNIVQFIGATVESNVCNIVMEYCSKGSLEVRYFFYSGWARVAQLVSALV
jgi:serine/threonine protein kinase